MSNQFTFDHIIQKGNNRFDIIKYISFIYDIYELRKDCKSCRKLLPVGAGVCVGPLFSFFLNALCSSVIILPRNRAGWFA